mmetsp:Transcript_13011/g.17898  ORF Transcript_13011/g.17898 Transcript_13011/m.17898 type:complete len:183 (+) Transcript_13011:132-680(+)
MTTRSLLAILLCGSYAFICDGFTVHPTKTHSHALHLGPTTLSRSNAHCGPLEAKKSIENSASELEGVQTDRRTLMNKVFMASFAAIAVSSAAVIPSEAAEEATIWKTGKAPIVPGQKKKDPKDVSGTRKDPSFLRSISDCKNQCMSSYGPDGLAKPQEDCLSECQDICCTTYEQCTFAIVPR